MVQQCRLHGKTILLTRPRHQTEMLRQRLEEEGAVVQIQPTIEILPPQDWTPLDTVLQDLAQFDWLIFSSQNGVESFFQRIETIFSQRPALFLNQTAPQTKIAAMGPGTAAALVPFGCQADLIPDNHCAEGMLAALQDKAVVQQRFLSLRANRGRQILAQEIMRLGGTIHEVVAYQSRDIDAVEPDLLERMRRDQIDFVTVTSSAIAASLIRLFGSSLLKTRIISLSPLTSAIFQKHQIPITQEAQKATMDELFLAILRANSIE